MRHHRSVSGSNWIECLGLAARYASITCLLVTISSPALDAQAQTDEPTPSPELSRLDEKIHDLEQQMQATVQSFERRDTYNRWIVTGIGAVLALLVGIQGYTAYQQMSLEWARSGREDRRDTSELPTTRRMVDIMDVIERTIRSRLDAETEAREEAAAAQAQLEDVLARFRSLEIFVQNFHGTIQRTREEIEEIAEELATGVSRHEFKGIVDRLGGFADQFDRFQVQLAPLDSAHRFSAKALYVRGIAAHYLNDPDRSRSFLTQVVSSTEPEEGETEISHGRRLANAYYYLGLTDSNFAEVAETEELLEPLARLWDTRVRVVTS